MSSEENDSENSALLYDFPGLESQIAELPHVICSNNEESFHALMGHLCTKIGLWGGCCPPFGSDGKGFDDREVEWPLIDHFKLWKLPGNQAFALRKGFKGYCGGNTVAVVDVRTDVGLLTVIKDEFKSSNQPRFTAYEDDFATLIKYINQLGWMYIPLQLSENDYALFVTNEKIRSVVDSAIDYFAANGVKFARLVRLDSQIVWSGPASLH